MMEKIIMLALHRLSPDCLSAPKEEEAELEVTHPNWASLQGGQKSVTPTRVGEDDELGCRLDLMYLLKQKGKSGFRKIWF